MPLAQVLQNPEDLDARLAYARELASPRGELIEVQVRLAQKVDPQTRRALRARERELLPSLRHELSAGVVDAPLQPVLVSVALLSTLSTSLMLRLADPIVRGVHHALPGRLHSLLSLYEMWFEKLRAPTPKKRERSRLRAAVIAIAARTTKAR